MRRLSTCAIEVARPAKLQRYRAAGVAMQIGKQLVVVRHGESMLAEAPPRPQRSAHILEGEPKRSVPTRGKATPSAAVSARRGESKLAWHGSP